MKKQSFEDFQIGDNVTSIGRTVSESEIYRYAGLAGSYGELHTNQEVMKQTDYGERLAQGMLALTYLYGFTTMVEWEPKTLALYGIDKVRFLNPLFIGDTVHLEYEVKAKEPRNESSGIVTFDATLKNQDDQPVAVCDWLLLVERE